MFFLLAPPATAATVWFYPMVPALRKSPAS